MIHPNREHTLALLTDWQRHHTAVETLMDGITASIGLDIDGPMFDTVWKLWDAYTSSLAAEVGDFDEWMQWFSAENEMGTVGKAAGYGGKTKPIKTLAHLYELILESRARGLNCE